MIRTLALILIFAGGLAGCRSYRGNTLLHNPEGHESLQFGTCQPGAIWPQENNHFKSSPLANERYNWAAYLQSTDKQNLFDDMGIQWVRSDFSWKRIEPQQGEWNFEQYDWLIDGAVQRNHKVLALLVYDVPWIYEKEGTSRNITKDEREHYLNYVRTVARRYGEKIGGFEIWNEPNFPRFWRGSDEDFFALTREAIQVLKEEAPGVPVAVGALSYHPMMGGKSFLKKMMAAGALEGADALSLHPYSMSLEAAAHRVADAKALLRDEGYTHQIWITEMGFPTTGLYPHKVSIGNHFNKTVKALTLMTAAGANLITWYKVFDSYNPEDIRFIVPSERSFGLMSRKKEWKPGAYAFAMMTSVLNNKEYNPSRLVLEGLQKSLLQAFLYDDKNGETIIVVWSRNPGKNIDISVEGMNEFQIITEDSSYKGSPESVLVSSGAPLVIKGESNDKILITVRLDAE
ncbi:glycosyl hydrolase family protein [Oceanispirochaeta crateris]|uniref:Glycosyl hydrolase family protein n=1 Tax=Oceanispirochaeta crateris TaxID=2518645 RepID=A0A5C1QRN3_9SPIO|nr:family 1 glycosylhydrolase [Oceanispirochaeta crateris]QEN08742.1 glycosyl hydrolase family protein [Oceanispirochaeta crateris]